MLKPVDERNVWLVVTRWADEQSYEAWVSGSDFAKAHGGRPADESGMASKPAEGAPGPRPVGMSAELWTYEVAGGSKHSTEA